MDLKGPNKNFNLLETLKIDAASLRKPAALNYIVGNSVHWKKILA